MQAWRDLEKKQRFGIVIGVPGLNRGFDWLFHLQRLAILGPRPRCRVLSFVLRDGDNDLQDQIATVQNQIAKSKPCCSKVEPVKQQLAELRGIGLFA